MTQEEKQILLKDLCGRLPYGVKVKYRDSILELGYSLYAIDGTIAFEKYPMIYFMDKIDTVKPYLRPMSSMTEEEYKEYDSATDLDVADSAETLRENLKAKTRVRISKWYHGTDWLDAHHFDYRGLIPMGLALEAPEGMYKLS